MPTLALVSQPECGADARKSVAPVTFPDPDIATYLDEIGRTPLLSREEEITLAARIACGDEEARQHLIEANLRLVVSSALSLRTETLDRSLGEWGTLSLAESIVDEEPPESLVCATEAREERSRLLRLLLDTLSARERLLIVLLYGLGAPPVHSYSEAGRKLGCCKERVRQLKERALAKLRAAAGTQAAREGGAQW